MGLIGEPPGIATILEMVHHTRLDCAVAAAGLMRLPSCERSTTHGSGGLR